MTQQQKSEVVDLIQQYILSLGSQAKVAKRCDVSEATLSQMRAQNWDNIAEPMWAKVAAALGWRPQGWVIADTTSTRIVQHVLNDAKGSSLFAAISHRAGSGKTASLQAYAAANRQAGVFYLSCREWAKREFLVNLAQSLGVDGANRAMSVDALLMQVVSFFQQRRAQCPLLILDEADKLRGAALRSLITLFNECEDGLGVVIAGTDHLSKQMQADARHNRKGSDELMSRFGRRFFQLMGATEADVRRIAEANGLADAATITAIFKECEPVARVVSDGQRQASRMFVEDLRRVKRAIQRELLKQQNQPAEEAVAA